MSEPRGSSRRGTGADRGADRGGVIRGASTAGLKGAALVGAAVLLGIVLLQVVDDGTTGPVADDGTVDATTTVPDPDTTDPTDPDPTTPPAPTRDPEEVRVLVLNGGAPGGSAGAMSTALEETGYVNQPVPASDWPEFPGSANTVMCRTGFEADAEPLALAVGSGTEITEFSDPPPPASDEADCVVVVATAPS